jgi:hypothetical protein
LYPIVAFPGWGDDRHCETGLWGMADEQGHREIHRPLAEELLIQQKAVEETSARINLNPGVEASALDESLTLVEQ